MKILDKDEPIVHVLHFFPEDASLFANQLYLNICEDSKFNVMFTFVADTQEFPAMVVDVLDYIKSNCKNGSACLDILTFDNHGIQLGSLAIDSNLVDIRKIVPVINKSIDDVFTYHDWLENPSRPSIVADSDMNATYIIHMMKVFLNCNIEPRPISKYGNKKNPLGT